MKPTRTPSHSQPARSRIAATVTSRLRDYFMRNGYARFQLPERVAQDGSQVYKKGDEVRMVATDADELDQIRDLLVQAGFNPGRPFVTHGRYRLPVYGREAVSRFLALVGRRRHKRPRRSGD